MTNQLSLLPPSRAARRIVCPGSRALELQFYSTQEDSPAAKEGTDAHWLAQEYLKRRVREHKTDFNYADEINEHAKLYADYVYSFSNRGYYSIAIEERVHIRRIHPNCSGTPDAFLYDGSTVHIFDFKYGFGQIEVFENWQLIAYAAGILDSIGTTISPIPVAVTFHIVQPRGYHPDGPIRTWATTAQELQPYFDRLAAAEEESLREDARCVPSPQCKYCTARHACPTLQQAALQAVDIVGQSIPFELSNDSLGSELRLLHHTAKLVDARITGLEEQTRAKLKSGERIPYYKLEATMGRQNWNTTTEEVLELGQLLGCNLAKPIEVVTPKQAEKLGMPSEMIAQYSQINKGEMKLTPVSESDLRKLFKGSK